MYEIINVWLFSFPDLNSFMLIKILNQLPTYRKSSLVVS